MIAIQEEEKRRNSLGLDILCIHKSHPLSIKIFSFWERNKDNPKLSKAKVKRKINPEVRCVIIMAKGLSSCTFFVFALQISDGFMFYLPCGAYGGLKSVSHTETEKYVHFIWIDILNV